MGNGPSHQTSSVYVPSTTRQTGYIYHNTGSVTRVDNTRWHRR